MPHLSPPPLDPAQFPLRRTYLNVARHGPLPRRAADAVRNFLDEAAAEASDAWMDWDTRHGELRRLGAELQGASSADDVCLLSSTTQLLAVVANGLSLGAGDRVVARATAFPSTRLVWEGLARDGVTVDLIGDDVRWEEALSSPASVVVAQWVRTDTGERADLAALADMTHRAGGILVVDAIQGLGVVPARFADWGVDAAGAGGFKWLLAPEGTGFGYLTPALRQRLRPTQPGWYSDWRGQPGDDGLLPALAFTEGGAPNSMGNAALHASVRLLLDAGLDRIWSHVDALTRAIIRGLGDGVEVVSPQAEGRRSGILTVRCDPSTAQRLAALDVVVSPRSDGVRISPHGFTTAGEIARLLAGF